MADELRDRKIALEQPRRAVEEAGARAVLLSLDDGEIQAMNGDIDKGDTFAVDAKVADASVEDFDALILPGGTVNPDKLRIDEAAVGFVRDFVESGKPVGVICHGPWTLAEADVLTGRRITSWPSIRSDLRRAGAEVVDEPVVVDRNLISSRKPDDLPAFCETIVREFSSVHAA